MQTYILYYSGCVRYEANSETEALQKFENDTISPIEVNVDEIEVES
jgi:hypothetical protein